MVKFSLFNLLVSNVFLFLILIPQPSPLALIVLLSVENCFQCRWTMKLLKKLYMVWNLAFCLGMIPGTPSLFINLLLFSVASIFITVIYVQQIQNYQNFDVPVCINNVVRLRFECAEVHIIRWMHVDANLVITWSRNPHAKTPIPGKPSKSGLIGV